MAIKKEYPTRVYWELYVALLFLWFVNTIIAAASVSLWEVTTMELYIISVIIGFVLAMVGHLMFNYLESNKLFSIPRIRKLSYKPGQRPSSN